jgi:hypothetical protein
MKRVATAELLDTDAGTRSEIADSLSDLRRLNKWFGGTATTQAMIKHIAGQLTVRSFSLLEVAAASGYVPHTVRSKLKDHGIQLEFSLLDRVPSHLANGNGHGRSVVGDALALPFSDSSFDLVSSGLFAHHLSPEQLVQFATEALRVGRIAVLINDLVRHPLHLGLVYAGLPLYRSRLTRHDAPASVRQAYTPQEMRELLAQTHAARVEILRHYLFRMGVIVWKA